MFLLAQTQRNRAGRIGFLVPAWAKGKGCGICFRKGWKEKSPSVHLKILLSPSVCIPFGSFSLLQNSINFYLKMLHVVRWLSTYLPRCQAVPCTTVPPPPPAILGQPRLLEPPCSAAGGDHGFNCEAIEYRVSSIQVGAKSSFPKCF